MTMDYEYLAEQYIKKPKDAITVGVMEDLKSRADRGVKKYSTTLEENNHDSMLQHAYEEALDLAQYLKKEIVTLKAVQALVLSIDDNASLGETIRKIYGPKA